MRAQVTTSYCNMATLHTPIAILLSHLQAAYNNIIFNFRDYNGSISGGVAVALLRLLRRVSESVESVNRRKGVGRGGGSITTLK